MNKEIELRFKINNKIRDKITHFSKYWESENQEDYYYRGAFKGVIRIRKTDNKNELCYKCFDKEHKGLWIENETNIGDPNVIEKIFKKMKLDKFLKIKKDRETTMIVYKKSNVTINIDNIKGLGLFCEVELISEKNKKDVLLKLIKELGIEKSRIINKGYVQLMLTRQKEYGNKKPKNKTKNNR